MGNGLRIVACVNGCEGVNPGAVPDLLAACRAVERAEPEWDAADFIEQVRTAIAKATEER